MATVVHHNLHHIIRRTFNCQTATGPHHDDSHTLIGERQKGQRTLPKTKLRASISLRARAMDLMSQSKKRAAGQEHHSRTTQRTKRQADDAAEASVTGLGTDDVTMCVVSDTVNKKANVDISCPLADLCHIEDIWENICCNLDGDALCRAARVPMFCSATRRTPAFILLAGVNNDAQLVHWHDPNNVLSVNFNPECTRCDKLFPYCNHKGCDWDREMTAIIVGENMLQQVSHPAYVREIRSTLPRARPTSPMSCAVTSYEPCNEVGCDHCRFMKPPVFGVRPGYTYAPFWNDVLVRPPYDEVSSDWSESEMF